MVRSQRKHHGFDTPSYVLKNLSTGTTTTRNERDIRKIPGNVNQTADTANMLVDTENAIAGIMKQNTCMSDTERQETAYNTEQSGRGESSGGSINPAHTDTNGHSNRKQREKHIYWGSLETNNIQWKVSKSCESAPISSIHLSWYSECRWSYQYYKKHAL